MTDERIAKAELMLERLQKLDRAVFLRAVEGLSDIWLGLVRSWGSQHRQLADRLLVRAVQIWPDLPQVHEAVAERLAEDGDLKGAEAFYLHALRLAPDRDETWYKLALLRSEARDATGAGPHDSMYARRRVLFASTGSDAR